MSNVNAQQTKMPGRLSNFYKNTLLVFVSLILALTMCEVFLRFYNPFGFRIKGDNIILPVNKKEIIYHDQSTKIDKVVIHQNNSLGFKGEEPPKDWDNWLTIFAVGGSTTECLEIAPEKTWPHQLGVKLRQHFSKLWINNAGLCGHSSFGHYVLIRDFIYKLKPKVIVFLVGINEIGISDAREFDTRLQNKISFRSLDKFLSSMAYYSEAVSVVLNLYRYYFPKAVIASGQRDMGELDLSKLPELAVSENDKLHMLKIHRENYLKPYATRLRRLVTICRDHGIEPVFVTQPVVFGNVYDDVTGLHLGKIIVMNNMNGELGWEVLELYNDTTRQVAVDEGVFLVDLARELPKSSRYYYDLMHFSNEGAQQVGAIIAQHLGPYLARKYQNSSLAHVP